MQSRRKREDLEAPVSACLEFLLSTFQISKLLALPQTIPIAPPIFFVRCYRLLSALYVLAVHAAFRLLWCTAQRACQAPTLHSRRRRRLSINPSASYLLMPSNINITHRGTQPVLQQFDHPLRLTGVEVLLCVVSTWTSSMLWVLYSEPCIYNFLF